MPLTDEEIRQAMAFVETAGPEIVRELDGLRVIVSILRNLEMTETNLAMLEFYTEKSCRFYNFAHTAANITEDGIRRNRNDERICRSVRGILEGIRNAESGFNSKD